MSFEVVLPIPVKKTLKKIGNDIRKARIRRRITMELMSQRASLEGVLEFALSVAKECGLEQNQAKKIAKQVGEAVKNWKYKAKAYQISSAEIERMASAFDHRDLSQAISF